MACSARQGKGSLRRAGAAARDKLGRKGQTMKVCKEERPSPAAQGRWGLIAFAVVALAGSWPQVPASASVQLTQFSVTSPPPPETEPEPASKPRSGPLAAAAASDLPANDPTVGTLAGQAGTDGGAATYHVPIAVPPGRAGMEPNLALNYNSRNGNGPLGLGWSIAGLSAIHRCPQTPEQDGATRGVAYDANDRLCLDGQRLVAVSGSYGQAGTEYRTEVDGFARITQFGGDLAGTAACFRVEQKDGRVLHYGAIVTGTNTCDTSTLSTTANARVQPGGAAATSSWLLLKVEDRVGNNELLSYAAFGNGENLIQEIRYTGFTDGKGVTTVGDRKVSFAWQVRTNAASGVLDTGSSYLAGGLSMQTQALASITTSVGGAPVRSYTPHYVAAAYSGRLLLASLTECATGGGSTACHPATQFIYNDAALNAGGTFAFTSLAGIGVPNDVSDQSKQVPLTVHAIGDLDGDGTRETAIATHDHSLLVQMTGDRTAHSVVDLTGAGFDVEPSSYVDLDGDGRAELMKTQPSSDGHLVFGAWKLARGAIAPAGSAYASLFTDYPSNIPFKAGDVFYAGDFNGDGKPDVVRVEFNSAACGAPNKGVWIYFNVLSGPLGSSGNTTAQFTVPSAPAFCLHVATDANSNIVAQTIDHIGDFNGDGLPDFYLRSDTTTNSGATYRHFDGIEITQSGGSTTFKACGAALGLIDDPTSNSPTDDCTWSQVGSQANFTTWLDVNGDGLEDFVIARPNQATWRVRLNQGGRFGAEIDTGSGYGLDLAVGASFRYPGRLPNVDLDGDGKPDLLVPSTDLGLNNGFALKMCTLLKFNFSGSECPGSNGQAPTAVDASGTLMCPVYACPEDPGTNTLNMPSLLNSEPVIATYSTANYHGVAPGGVDNSLYHLSMLKFVQTDATHISVMPVHTPLIGRLGNPNQPPAGGDDLFGDGLADLSTIAGCVANIVINGLYQCATIADGTYGPNAALPDGTQIACPNGPCYFDSHAV